MQRSQFDSLGSNPETTLAIINEKIKAARNNNKTTHKVESPGHGDYLYRNLEKGKITTYTQVWDSYYKITEDIPTIEWAIHEEDVYKRQRHDMSIQLAKVWQKILSKERRNLLQSMLLSMQRK